VRRRRFLLAALAALLLPAAASAGVVVRGVDASGYPRIRLMVVTPVPTKTPPALTEAGAPAAGLIAVNLAYAKSVVLAIDRSQSMRGRPLAEAVAAARAFVAAKPPSDRIAVTTFATKALLLTGFSSSTIDADTALRSISDVASKQGTRLYDDVVLAADALGHESRQSRLIILVTDGNETLSDATLEDAIAAARRAHAAVYVVAIESSRFTPEPLRRLAAETGGKYFGAASAEALTGVYQEISDELQRTWRLEYLTAARPGQSLPLAVSVPGQGRATAILKAPGSAGTGPSGGPLPAYFYEPWGTAALAGLVGLLVLVSIGLFMGSAKIGRLRGRLQPHLGVRAKAVVKRKTGRERFAALAGLFSATERAFAQTKQWRFVSRLLERADLPLRTVEFVYLTIGASLGLGILVAITGASSLAILIAFGIGALAPYLFVHFKANRRRAAFENQLPDVLTSIAASLKAGHSFKQAIQSLVDEGYEPASKELKRVLAETRLGRPMEQALGEMAERVGSENFSFIVTAVNIQTQVGGSLAGLFDMVADTVRQRQQFARKIKSLTAMGRMSAYVLVGLPFFVGFCLTLLNRGYMDPLYHTSTGHTLLMMALVAIVIGSLILKKIVSFKG
jgi:tight adherence protein B